MKKLLFLFVIIFSGILFSGCVNSFKNTNLENKNEQIQEQEVTLENAEVSESTSLDDLEQELDETVILEESFTDL